MSGINDGGTAFPCLCDGTDHAGNLITGPFPCMTLRDWFAGQALHLFYWQRPEVRDGESGQDALSRMAYLVADAMIAARGNGGAE
jgi:hypothetical protein